MWSHVLAAILPPIISEVVDKVTDYFTEEKEKAKPVKKKVTVKKKSYDTAMFDNKVIKSIKADYKEWKSSKAKVIEGTHCKTQKDFVNYVNKKYGTRKSYSSIMRIAKGE